jgi:hypothetical protein
MQRSTANFLIRQLFRAKVLAGSVVVLSIAMIAGAQPVAAVAIPDQAGANHAAVWPADKKEVAAPPSAAAADKDRTEKPANDDSAAQAQPEIKRHPVTRVLSKPVPAAARNVPQFVNAAPAPNQQLLAPQLRARLEPMLKVELSFANRAAGLNDEERRSVIAASKKWLDDFVVDFGKNMDPNRRQMWMQGMHAVGGRQGDEDPRESIQRGVAEVLAANLPPEKVASYKAESDKRAAFHRQVTIEALVDLIDTKVNLSSDQRGKITASLSDHWDPVWAPQLEIFTINSDLWPNIPDELVSPSLTPAQRGVLNQLNRQNGVTFIGAGGFGREVGEIDDISLEDDSPNPDTKQK